MQAIVYYISIPFIYLISILPFWLLYRVSDLIYFLTAFVIKYRKQVILTNLQNSFPEKNDKEINKIYKEYYRFLCDLILETLKGLTVDKKHILKRCALSEDSLVLLENFYRKKKSIILASGHLGNWEWSGHSLNIISNFQLYVIYKPLANKYFDRLIYNIRTKHGVRLIPMKETYKQMAKNKSIISATAFIADQTPAPDNAYWTMFLNQDTPMFLGMERVSTKINYPIVFLFTERIKRGHYKMHMEKLFDEPKYTKEGEITEAYVKRLEAMIKKQPEIWLWSHRRWKHKRV